MAATIDIILRKDKINKRNESPLHIRIIKNRRVQYLATGIKLEKKYWDDDKRKVKRNYPNSVRLNNYVNALKIRYHDEILKCETSDTAISSRQIKKKIVGNNDLDFFKVSNQIIEKYRLDKKSRTYNKAVSIVQKLKDFLGADKLQLEEITTDFLSKYEDYLKDKLHNKINTINKDMRFIRRVFNEAYRMDLVSMDKNPFYKYALRTEKTSKTFLTEDEILRIERLTLEKDSRMALHRDMFIFSTYAGGLRVSDTLLLKWKDFDGSNINLSIQKTNTHLSIKLPNKAVSLISYYKKNRSAKNFVFPMLDDGLDIADIPVTNRAISSATAYINKNLKLIAEKAKIEKNLSFHVARHTWATRALRKGISIDKVSKLMGHSAIKETQIYAKIVNEELDKAMDVFNL